MLTLDEVIKNSKFTKHQVNLGLLKSGHITQKDYEYLENLDKKEQNENN